MPETHSEHGSKAEESKLVSIPQMPALLVEAGIKPVSASRIRQLLNESGFPKPVYEHGKVRLYDWGAVEAFFRGRVLRPGERTDLKRKQEDSTDEPAGGGS